jgi:hypothetical protein
MYKLLKNLKKTKLDRYYQGFILADLQKAGFLHPHQKSLVLFSPGTAPKKPLTYFFPSV